MKQLGELSPHKPQASHPGPWRPSPPCDRSTGCPSGLGSVSGAPPPGLVATAGPSTKAIGPQVGPDPAGLSLLPKRLSGSFYLLSHLHPAHPGAWVSLLSSVSLNPADLVPSLPQPPLLLGFRAPLPETPRLLGNCWEGRLADQSQGLHLEPTPALRQPIIHLSP